MNASNRMAPLLLSRLIFIASHVMAFLIFFNSHVLAKEPINELALQEEENSSPDIAMVKTVIVTAKRVESQQERTAENVAVYTEEDIDKLPARNLGEVLAYIPAVDVQVTSQFGQSTALSIHGSDSRHVLVMVDGIPFNTQLSGQANPTRIPIEHVERIEVIKGASSSAWGSSLGGVVNVITKDVGDSAVPKGNFTSSVAEFSTTKNSLDVSGKIAELGYFVTGSFFETDGPQSVTDVQETKGFGKFSHLLGDEAELTGSFGYSGANVRYGVTPANRINSQPYNSRYGKILLDINKEDFPVKLSYKYNDQDITTDIFNAATGALVSSTVSSSVSHGISLNTYFELYEDNLLVMGADFDWHAFKSNIYLDSGKGISMQAPYINYTLRWNDMDVISGIRFDHNERFGSQTSPSVGMVYHFRDSGRSLARAKISRAFNAPPLLWIFNDAPPIAGPNPDLKAERSLVYEIGFETDLFDSLDLGLNFYRADIKDAIWLVFKNGAFVRENFRKFRRQGGELLLNYELNDHLMFYASGAFNDAENRETRETVRDQGIARQSFTLGGNYKNESGFGFNLSGYYNRWSSAPSLQPNDRKFIFDAKLTQEFKDILKDIELELFLNVFNLTNSKYWSSITFPLPRRYFEGGLSLKF
jgi:vitamin B12 transporter